MWCNECNWRRGPSRRLARIALCVGLFTGSAAAGDPPTLRVSGKATIETEARLSSDGFELRATLRDEVGRPLAGAEVRLRAASDADGPATLHRCGDPRGEAAGELLLRSDQFGRTCVTVTGLRAGSVELKFEDARGYLERTSRVVRLPDGVSAGFEIGFEPPVTVLSLDEPVQRLGLVTRALGGGAAPEAGEIVLSMVADGSERELGRTALDGLGEIQQLNVASTTFGRPGHARLVARLRARSGQQLAQASCAVVRAATVQLSVDAALESGVEPGAVLRVQAASSLGPAPAGVIEVRSRGMSLAVARVADGVASVVLPVALTSRTGGMVSLQYAGDGAGWLPGPHLKLRLLAVKPGYAGHALWIAAAALTALAVVLGWRPVPRARPTSLAQAPRARASVEVLEVYETGGGYRGFVRDAHEGNGVSPASVAFVAPGSPGVVLAQVVTRGDGSFSIEPAAFPVGTQVEVTAPYHATLRAPLPAPGVVELSLISRRRALLERLVRWAERRGKPWTKALGEPTPAHVAEVASTEAEPQVEIWARKLEQLAFGPTPPDAGTEAAAGVGEDPKLRQGQRTVP